MPDELAACKTRLQEAFSQVVALFPPFMKHLHRRQFLRDLGISASALPFLAGLPSLTGAVTPKKKQRLIIMFSPNGTLPNEFWPDQQGADFSFKSILKPLSRLKTRC